MGIELDHRPTGPDLRREEREVNDHRLPEACAAPAMARDMLVRTWTILETLAPELRDRCIFPLDDARRVDWDFIPKPDRSGVALRHLDSNQRVLVQLLVRTGLSEVGFSKVLSVMAMENLLRDREVEVFGLAAAHFRHADNYYLSFFGRPGFDETWGWRFMGHHVSLNFTVVDQTFIIPTPLNLGAQPAGAGVIHPLGREEDGAFGLLESLDSQQAATSRIHPVAPADYVTRQVPLIGDEELPDYVDLGMPQYRLDDADRKALRFSRKVRSGLRLSSLDRRQWALLERVVREYSDRIHESMSESYFQYMMQDAAEQGSFVWAGDVEKGSSHYYRLELPRHLIEFCNAVDSGNHIHSELRDLDHDFGSPVLPVPELPGSMPESLRSRLVSSVERGPR